MLKYSSTHIFASGALVLSAAMASPLAIASCCPSDGNGAPQKAASGLGEPFPAAADLASDTAWQLYEFERDGIRYVQVNDQYGKVRVAVGRIGDVLWVLPIGGDADRVALPGDRVPSGQPKSLYRSNDIEVILYQNSAGDRWLIRSPRTDQ